MGENIGRLNNMPKAGGLTMARSKTIQVFFEFKVRQDGSTVIYRGIKDRLGRLRMEKRRANATNFKTFLVADKLDKDEQIKNILSRPCTALIEG
jgi:hypothetical protein